eukprot:5660680-Pyramimonas_sp.AAC.1
MGLLSLWRRQGVGMPFALFAMGIGLTLSVMLPPERANCSEAGQRLQTALMLTRIITSSTLVATSSPTLAMRPALQCIW